MRWSLGLLLLTSLSQAKVVSENFSTRNYYASGSLQWNQGLQVLQPTAEVQNIQVNFVAQANQNFDFGDGSHGSFEYSRFSYFSNNIDYSGKIIYLDLTNFSNLKVTRFHLPVGWTLRPQGSAAFKIYSQSDVIIDGTIDCSGEDGTAGTVSAAGSGGLAHCGGGNGGAGGLATANGSSGFSPNGAISGGGGGIYGGVLGAGGGGGGAFADAAGTQPSASNGNGTGGSGGNYTDTDPLFLIEKGGAGGGGGSGGSVNHGGGGGAGGGFVVIHAGQDLTIGTSGKVLAKGGNGGGAVGNGGPGGAGGGGAIKAWAARNFVVNNNVDTYAFDADAGVRGTVGAVNGGTASYGRSWIDLGNFTTPGGATYYPNESAQLTSIGQVRYLMSSLNVTTAAYDTQSTLALPVSFSVTPASADWTVLVAGSNDHFVSDDTGWLTLAQIADLKNKRYVRFQLTLNNSSATSPTQATSLSYSFEAGVKEEFNMKAVSCAHIDVDRGNNNNISFLFLLMPIFLFSYLKFKLKLKLKLEF